MIKIKKRLAIVRIDRIKCAEHNPDTRIDPNSRAEVRKLAKSISTITCIYPPIVTDNMTLVEGHRRYAAAKLNGEKYIEVFIVSGISPEELYIQLNSNQKSLSANDWLKVYLVNPLAVRPKLRTEFDNALAAVGRVPLKKLTQKNLSIATYRQAKRIARYCEMPYDSFVKKTLLWLIEGKYTRFARIWMDTCCDKLKFILAITKGELL